MSLLQCLSFSFKDTLNILLFSVFLYISHFYYQYFTRVNKLPGPFPLPIIGSVCIPILLLAFQLLLQKQYGDVFEVWLSNKRKIYLCRVEHWDKLLSSSTKTKWLSRMGTNEGLHELGMNQRGILANDNLDSWKFNRYFFNQAMLTPSFNIKAIDATNKIWKEMELYWNTLGNDYQIELSQWMQRFTIDMIIEITTGKRAYTLPVYFNTFTTKKIVDIPSAILDDSEYFIHNIQKYVAAFTTFAIFPYYIRHYVPILKNFTKIGIESRDNINGKIMDIIKNRRKEIEEKNDNDMVFNDMLSLLIVANTEKDNNKGSRPDLRPMTDDEIMGNIRDAFIGGSETTTNAICVLVYYICKHPKVLKKLRQELDAVFGEDHDRPFTSDDISKLKYCEAILYEAGRMHPIAHSTSRVNTEPDELLGYQWPARSEFIMFFDGANKHPLYWKDPEIFNPDRFLDDNIVKRNFILFGKGIRQCPGKKLAMIEMIGIMAMLFRKYDVTLINEELHYKSMLFNSIIEGMFVKLTPRKDVIFN
ncbi:22134_t:CDS:2 [Cetraspora pellucida]|uniref:22134_t:CDS:1 n=1 Tax=Cetraspora pellucida TaxID=1433469 RepID=A0A9N9HG52_9GLOM|nr:22134_t:CDS:2 [Cetraspora pellucida]